MNALVRVNLSPALRDAADFLDLHPGITQPYITTSADGTASLSWYLMNDAGQKDAATGIVRAIGGKWDKSPAGDELFNFDQTCGLLRLQVSVKREAVCERVVVSTEKVTIPAQPAVEAQPERVETREVVAWRCEPLLADVEVSA